MKPEILFITKSLPVMLLIGVNSYLSSCYTEIKKIGLTPGFTLYIWRRLLATPLVATPPDLELSIFHMCVSRFIHSNQEKGFWHGTCRLSRAGGREGGQGGLHRRLQAQERPHLWNLQRRWLSHPLREHWRYWKVEPAALSLHCQTLFFFVVTQETHLGSIKWICWEEAFNLWNPYISSTEAWKSLTDKVKEARSNAKLKELSFEGEKNLHNSLYSGDLTNHNVVSANV